MKKKINILGTIALTTTASTSVIECGGKEEPKLANPTGEAPNNPPQDTTDEPEVAEIRLNDQVAKDLGLINSNNKSLVEVRITEWSIDELRWDFIPFYNYISQIKASKLLKKASKLLKDDNTAVSKESEEFLVNTLELTKKTDNKFDITEADSITVETSEIKPTWSKKEDGSDYIVTGGTFKLQFVKGTEKLGDNYTIDLKDNENGFNIQNGLNIKSLLEIFWIENDNFTKIKDFVVGEDNSKPENGTPVYEYLKTNSDVYKKLEWLNELLIDTGDKVSIIVVDRDLIENSNVWDDDDKNYLICKIKFGTITSDNLIQLYPYLS